MTPQSESPQSAVAKPSEWNDLKRDWQRWSQTERFVTEWLAGLAMLGIAAAIFTAHLP